MFSQNHRLNSSSPILDQLLAIKRPISRCEVLYLEPIILSILSSDSRTGNIQTKMSSSKKQSSSSKGNSHKHEHRHKGPSTYTPSSDPDYYYTEEPHGYSYQQPVAYNTQSSGGYSERAAWKWTCVRTTDDMEFCAILQLIRPIFDTVHVRNSRHVDQHPRLRERPSLLPLSLR